MNIINADQHLKIWLLAWVVLLDTVVEIITLGLVSPSLAPKVLFSKWMD